MSQARTGAIAENVRFEGDSADDVKFEGERSAGD